MKRVCREYDDAIGDSFTGFHFSQDPNNYYSGDNICDEVIDEFKHSKKVSRVSLIYFFMQNYMHSGIA